ncbi:MAG: hypothetical protein V2A53_01095 [bacterium]
MKKELVFGWILVSSLAYGTGSVTVYDSGGGFVGSYTTIQAGVNVCPNEGTVWVENGTYIGAGNKDLTWSGKKITVRSVNGVANCIIDCEHSGRGFYLYNAYDCGTISGFMIRNGYVTGGV